MLVQVYKWEECNAYRVIVTGVDTYTHLIPMTEEALGEVLALYPGATVDYCFEKEA